ncbi:hypothetical protein CLV80_11348 [Yoonia maritima]|uniref:Uncharacterized protein n=2 Tax=Yoonia maritima TaxID=1435347 RepID=A0A2T0VUR3_9RHOB|nr:hypothetical protein CLV80_11348 [Yoonia maritima]
MKYLTSFSFAAAVLMPVLVFAGPYDGVYKQTAHSECALVGVDGGSLKIEEVVFHGVEMECRMTNPVDINDMNATIYQMECSGAGQTWTERSILMKDAETDGIIMVWNGYAFRYDRCEEGEY